MICNHYKYDNITRNKKSQVFFFKIKHFCKCLQNRFVLPKTLGGVSFEKLVNYLGEGKPNFFDA